MNSTKNARISVGLLLSVAIAGSVFALEAGDSLISKSYLDYTYRAMADQAITTEIETVYNQVAEEKFALLAALEKQYLGITEGDISGSLMPREFANSQEILLEEGSLLLPFQGLVSMNQTGTMIDLTTGTEINRGNLEVGHQYLVAEESQAKITVQSTTAQMGIQGVYTLSGESTLGHPFVDVFSSDWFYDSVVFVVNQSVFAGTDALHFSPEMTMDRSMMMTALYRLAGSPKMEGGSTTLSFVDVNDGDWYAPFVLWGASQQLTGGMGDGYFMPNGQVTRQQILVMLMAFAEDYLQADVSHNGSLEGYADKDLIASWATRAMNWGVGKGLFQGIPEADVYLRGESYATRAEVATIMMNFYLIYG